MTNVLGYSKKEYSEFYVPSVMTTNAKKYDSGGILLCQYEMMDTCIYIAMNSPHKPKVLLHNFANNNKPCDGLWDSNSQENQIYNRTNIKDLVLPIQHKLYPIQDDLNKKDSFGKFSANMIITENCMLHTTENKKILQESIYIDIVSMAAIVSPSERNLDFYTGGKSDYNSLTRYDYALPDDIEKMKQRIRFLLNYAIGEGYDYLITGAWGLGCFLNPHWGLINVWNIVIAELHASNLKILFCIPIHTDTTGESEFIYKYFNRYLIGQHFQVDFEELQNKQKIKEEMRNISKEEILIKSKIYGLVWGVALSEMNNYYINYKNNMITTDCVPQKVSQLDTKLTNNSNGQQQSLTPISNAAAAAADWNILDSEYLLDWDMCTDQTVLVMRTLVDSLPQMNIDPKVFAGHLIEWKSTGFAELENRPSTCNEHIAKHIVSQPGYAIDPLGVSFGAYKSKGMDDMSNSSFSRNMLNGIFKDYLRRTILCCRMIQPDISCQVSCLIHSFIIRSIWENKYITTEDWGNISNICFQMFNKVQDGNVQCNIDFDKYWMIGRNYQYKIANGLEPFLLQNAKLLSNNNTFIPMTMAIILMYDIQSYARVDGRMVKDMMNVIEIPIADDKLRKQKINYNEILPNDYYFCQMRIFSKINSNGICNAVVGSILGLACHTNVYNDLAIKDDCGNRIESNSQQWVKYATHKRWLNGEIEKFLNGLFTVRLAMPTAQNTISQHYVRT